MHIYDDNGYVNMREICASGYPFVFCVGGRATGKTYTTLKVTIEDGLQYIYMRRTQAQCDLISIDDFSPIKPLNNDLGWNIHTNSISKYNAGFYRCDQGDHPTGAPIGYTAALSTFSNIRGFDASNVERIIYDEFIPEPHERPLKAEAEALLNCYETCSRNREAKGRDPLQLVCLANSNNLANPIFLGLDLVTPVDRMQRQGREIWTDDKRGIMVVSLLLSPISAKKRDTAVYRMAGDNAFTRMSLSNSFADRDEVEPRRRPLSELTPIVSVGELCFYRHKSDGRYYASAKRSGNPPHFPADRAGLPKFMRQYPVIMSAYLEGVLDFESFNCYALFTNYLR